MESSQLDNTFQVDGDILSEADFDAITEVTQEDIQNALNEFNRIVPRPFKGMLDNAKSV